MILRAKLTFLFLFILFFNSLTAFNINEEECLNYTVYPVQYELTIIPYIYKDRMSFYNCEALITVIANVPGVQRIELDSQDFEIQKINVYQGDRDIINKFRPYEYNTTLGKVYIYLQEPLQQYSVFKTQYNIKISFRKSIGRHSSGIFLVPYEDNGTKYMISTRLSPNKAKHFFPCFENPRFEAVFKFRVYIIPSSVGTVYFNNSLVIAQEQRRHNLQDQTILIDYTPSPQVSLHQVGFHFSTFASKEVKAKNTNDVISVWAPANKLNNYNFILNFGEIILNLIHEYALVNRPLMNGPINIVPVPKNVDGFEVGSWNLLTNSESRLSYSTQFTSIRQIEELKFELTQQLCRIWLGNPGEGERTRWREEWFKEGVATYLAYYLLAQDAHGSKSFRHKWPIDNYGLQIKHKAMSEDWHHSTPALANFNNSLAVEIPSRYRELVMMKTASILWMIENWLGSEKFHTAMVKYINTRRGLYISLENFMTNLDLDTVECQHQFFNGSTASKILNSWFHQPGYPIINVNVLRDRTPNAIQLKQHKFSFSRMNRGDSHYLTPISYIIQNNENCFNCYQPRFTIDQTYTFEENLNGGWIILNRNASGYYRVNYDIFNWRLIAKTLKEDRLAIDELNRAQIVNDVLTLYAAGDINYALAIEVLDYLDSETSPIVWESVITGFDSLKVEKAFNMTRTLYKEWQEFMGQKVSKIYSSLVNNAEIQKTNRMFRNNIIQFACSIHHQPCLENLSQMYREYTNGHIRLDPDSRLACYYMLNQNNENYDQRGFNMFEIEDKVKAEKKMRMEEKFWYRIPIGEPVMDKIIMPPENFTNLQNDKSETTISTEKPNGNAASSTNVPLLMLRVFIVSFVLMLFS